MKKSFNFLFAALMIISAASCTQENLPDNTGSSEPRVISCAFEGAVATKTTIDGLTLTPKWSAGDKVKVIAFRYNESSYVYEPAGDMVVELSATNANGKITDGGNYFEFTIPDSWGALDGNYDCIYAIYPAAAFNSINPDNKKVIINIPGTQDGTFASANICVAECPVYEGSLIFRNVTSVFKMKVDSSKVKKIAVKEGGFSKISGTALVGPMDTWPLGMSVLSGSQDITVNVGSNDVYLSVNPCQNAFSSGSTFEFYDGTGTDANKLLTKTTSETNWLGMGKLFDLGEIEIPE